MTTTATVRAQNHRGQWVPAIPEPYYLPNWLGRLHRHGRCRCACGRVFGRRSRYREHYALTHILALGDGQ